MQCWQCGVRIRPGQKLCVYCGAKLIQDAEQEYDAPAERGGFSGRERADDDREGMRRSSAGSGARGSRAPEDEGWQDAAADEARGERYGSRERGREDGGDWGDDGRASRRAGGSRSSSREDLRSRDPLDDPRAPRSLRGMSGGGRSAERSRGGYESGSGDNADYEYDDYNPRDRASPRYQPRYDPDSAEYDAVADQRRQSRVRPRQDDARGRGGRGAGAGEWEDPRGGYDPRSGRGGGGGLRDEFGRGQRDGGRDGGRYGAERGGSYDGYRDGESAEYFAEYDERPGPRNRGMSASRGSGRSAPGGGPPEGPGYGGGDWNQYESRGAGGYDAAAMGGPGAPGWNGGGWAAGADSNAWAPPGGGFPAPMDTRGPAKKRRRRGLIAAVAALLVVVLLAGGYVERAKILSLLHRGGGGTPSSVQGFATYTPGPTPTPLANYKQNVDKNAQYVVEYPAAWSTQNQNGTSGGGYDYVDTYQQASPPIYVGIESAQAFNNQSNTAIIDGEVTGAKQQQKGLTFTQVGNDVTVNVGGENWIRRDYTISAANGATLHMAVLATHHAGRAYAIVLSASTADFAQDDSGVFKTMLSTYRFIS